MLNRSNAKIKAEKQSLSQTLQFASSLYTREPSCAKRIVDKTKKDFGGSPFSFDIFCLIRQIREWRSSVRRCRAGR